MIMSAAVISTYPQFARYVRQRMPEVLHVPLIVRNMRVHGSLSRAELAHALVWGAGPKLIITGLRSSNPGANLCGGVAAANGCFRPANSSQIELDAETVSNFENSPYGRGSDNTSSGRRVFIVGTTILHELCHWGNFAHGVAEASEQGVAFEVATYGRNTG